MQRATVGLVSRVGTPLPMANGIFRQQLAATSRLRSWNGSSIPRISAKSFVTFLGRVCNAGDKDIIPDLKDKLLSAFYTKEDTGPRRSILFLATPSHASLVSDPSVLGDTVNDVALSTNLEAGQACKSVRMVTAVVDAIPGSLAAGSRLEGWVALVTDRKFRTWGSELCRPDRTSPAWRPPKGHGNNSPLEPGTLSIGFRTDKRRKKSHDSSSNLDALTVVNVNLANTLFQTGEMSTAYIFSSGYKTDEDKKEHVLAESRYGRLKKAKHIRIDLDPRLKFNTSISLPLEQLTEPRRVALADGNIVKELVTKDEHGEQMNIGASKELEAAVAKWIQKYPAYNPDTLEKHPTLIYARVFKGGDSPPPKLRNLITSNNDKNDIADWNITRVISGGGGWGSKGGILALDSQTDGGDAFFASIMGLSAEPKLVQPGDWIEFYAVVKPIRSNVPGKKGIVFESLDIEESVRSGNADDSVLGGDTLRTPKFGIAAEGGMWLWRRKFDIPGMEVFLELETDAKNS